MKRSIDAAVDRKARQKREAAERELRLARERNKIALEKLKLDDQKFLERKRRDKVYRHGLAIQAHEDNVRKSVEKAAMDDVERQINQRMLDTVKDHYTKKGVWGKKNEPVNYRLS